jgi:hypothetical protein
MQKAKYTKMKKSKNEDTIIELRDQNREGNTYEYKDDKSNQYKDAEKNQKAFDFNSINDYKSIFSYRAMRTQDPYSIDVGKLK